MQHIICICNDNIKIYLEVSEKFTAMNNTGFKSSYSSGKAISASHMLAIMFRQMWLLALKTE